MANEIKQLQEYLFDIDNTIRNAAIFAYKEQIDIEAERFYLTIKRTSPTKSIADSFEMYKITDEENKYGYSFKFVGNSLRTGMSYEQIARWWNTGTYRINATYFISKAIRRLKGLDQRAYFRYQALLTKGSKAQQRYQEFVKSGGNLN